MERPSRFGEYVPADTDPNTLYSTGAYVQKVTDTGEFLIVADPQLSTFTIGGPSPYQKILYELATTDGMRRSIGISQLCKDKASATIPNTYLFSRHSGMMALMHMVDHFGRESGFTEEQFLAAQLVVSQDDSAHYMFSHATELGMQGWGGKENRHEELWPEYAQYGGALAVLEAAGVKVDDHIRMPGVQLPPWVSEVAPRIDLDKFQYGPTEGLEWFDNDNSPRELRDRVRSVGSLENIGVDADGHLAFKDAEVALLYAKMYLLYATEHWTDFLNRTQLFHINQAERRVILGRRFPFMEGVDKGQMRRPEWYLYGVDQDLVDAVNKNHGFTDPTLYAIHSVSGPMATTERSRFVRYKQREYGAFLLDRLAKDYPSEYLTPTRVEFGPSHPSISVTIEEGVDRPTSAGQKMPILDTSSDRLLFHLGPLKNRYTDPPVFRDDGSTLPLSEIHKGYRNLLAEQQRIMAMSALVELVFAGSFRESYIRGIRENEVQFDALAILPDFTDDQKRRMITLAARRAEKKAIEDNVLVLP